MNTQRPDTAELADMLKALADANRLAILDLLMQGVQCNGDINDRLGLIMSLVSHHLKVLRRAGLVNVERDSVDGRWIYHSVNAEKLARLREQLLAFLDPQYIQPRLGICEPRPISLEGLPLVER